AAFGLVTPPVGKYQAVGSLRLFGNYNWNQVTRDFQFLSVTPSVVGMRTPFKALSYGLKAEGTYTSKNTVDASTTATGNNFSSYSLTGDIGPLVRYDVTPSTRLVFEATWRPKSYFQDALSGDTRRTGMGFLARASASYTRSAYLNLTGYVSLEQDVPQGSAYQFIGPGAGIANAMYLTDKLTLSPLIDFTRPVYSQTKLPERIDSYYSFRVTAQYALATHWSLLADVGYVYNSSTVPATFQYNRELASLGATYFF
ncbi:MAG: hypothetical protein HY074_04925, partial [Deltaproteobacteria bacterium]|nr:hypothetical protein [Deltaproteobacteria bacterium]